MTPHVPVLNKDIWLTVPNALQEMRRKGDDKDMNGKILKAMIKTEQVRCWLCADGELRYQINPSTARPQK